MYALFLGIVLILTSTAGAETLAEAAAREAARRQRQGEGKAPVYTAGELSRPGSGGTYNPMTGAVETTTPRTRPSAPPGLVLPIVRENGGDNGADRRGGYTEAQWRERAALIHAHIASTSANLAALEKNPGGMAERKLVCPDGNPRCWNPKIESSSPGTRLIQARRRLAALQQALTDLEDEARRHSVPPGWLR
jgi:hypothetical protein